MTGWIMLLVVGFLSVAAWTAILTLRHNRRQQEMARLLVATRLEGDDRFHALADSAPIMMWMDNGQKESTYFNKAWLEFTGRLAEQDLGLGWVENVHPEDRERILSEYGAAFDERRKYRTEYRMRRRDGQYRWVLDTAGPRHHPDGSFAGFIGTTVDITEQKRALETLQDNEFKFRILVESSLAGVYIVQDQLFKYVNPRMCEIFGYTPEEMTSGMSAWAIVAPENVEHVTEHVRKRWEGEVSTVLYSFHGLRKDGKRIDVEVLGSITTFRGKPAIIGTMLDITERKNAEQALRQKDKQLLQVQKMDAVGRLAGGVAHDFNNLLTTILGYAQFALDETAPDDPRRAHLDEIVHSGQNAVRLTKQLLAFGRKEDLVVRPINIKDVVEDMGQLMRRTLGEDIELTVHADDAPGAIEADPSQLEQVILNLAINARDAMPAGGRLHLETGRFALSPADSAPAPQMPPGNYVLLVVRDTGTGMSDEVKAHVFEPFFTTKDSGKNSGLGLATVYGIIQQCRGYIAFTSEENRGTEFRIYLPLADTRTPKASASNLPRGTETILLVEDEDTVRRLTGKMLTSLGYQITEARDGREALRVYEQAKSPIHMIITDVVMPHMGGPELINRLKEQKSACPAMFISGFSDGRISGKNANTANIPLLRKPFTREELAAKVRSVLDGAVAAHHHGNL